MSGFKARKYEFYCMFLLPSAEGLCFGDSLQGYWSVRAVSENWHPSSEMQHVHLITMKAGFLPVTWHFPNKFVSFAEAHFPWDLQKASVSHDFLPSVLGLN